MTAARYAALRFVHPALDAPEETPGLRLTPTGRIDLVDEQRSVRQAVLLLLTTRPGERVMRPDYGCHLHRLIFSPNDDTTAGLAIHYVRQALARWERRIDVLRIDATRDEDPGRLNVWLEYRVRATQRTDQVAFSVDLGGGPL